MLSLSSPYSAVHAAKSGSFSCLGGPACPHSTFLQALSQLGIFGFSFFCLMLGIKFYKFLLAFRPSNKFCQVCSFASIGYLILFLSVDQLCSNYFSATSTYLLICLCCAVVFSNATEKVFTLY